MTQVLLCQQYMRKNMVSLQSWILNHKDKEKHRVKLNKTNYAKNLVSKFDLELAKHARTPMNTSLHISKDSSGTDVDLTLYRSMIWSLLYLTACRPDIAFSVGVCARYQACPKESHLLAVKRIIKYVNGTLGYGIWFTTDTTAKITGFSDADWARSHLTV
ncbi:uncharacterized protein LOC114303134 [Camellia sinensis]|uniref:uncharacterized protein LOC114303134 n=1 Tax=Camellia sinensis TaxID=4442 RepID=UPI001035F9D3|nr:uncharacterized protein LOC114303134 [Camellia sinensis]